MPHANRRQSHKITVEKESDATEVFTIATAWVDAAGRTRTWELRDPTGKKLAEVTTKRAAKQLATLLNNPAVVRDVTP